MKTITNRSKWLSLAEQVAAHGRYQRSASRPRLAAAPNEKPGEYVFGDHEHASSQRQLALRFFLCLALSIGFALGTSGCRTKAKAQNKEFFTSGSREADQRATQRMSKAEQLEGSGEGSGEKRTKKAAKGVGGAEGEGAQAQGKLSLFDRLGGEKGLTAIVDDFTPRLLEDPRVNWQRLSVRSHGIFKRTKSETWQATPANVENLKKHIVQFLALATGGPANYEGKEIKASHANMQISNPEFEAAVGDIKASLDKLQIPNKEQKELLAVIESTRPLIVTQR
jgi:hemoglobin